MVLKRFDRYAWCSQMVASWEITEVKSRVTILLVLWDIAFIKWFLFHSSAFIIVCCRFYSLHFLYKNLYVVFYYMIIDFNGCPTLIIVSLRQYSSYDKPLNHNTTFTANILYSNNLIRSKKVLYGDICTCEPESSPIL